MIVAVPTALASAMVLYDFPEMLMKRLEKSILPRRIPMGDIRVSLTNELTILPNAALIIMPTPYQIHSLIVTETNKLCNEKS